jgi:hypothetical protein
VQTSWLLTCGAAFELVGSALVLYSVPCEISAGGSLVDPKVVPRQFDGGAMRVLILLPDSGYDVTQVCVCAVAPYMRACDGRDAHWSVR